MSVRDQTNKGGGAVEVVYQILYKGKNILVKDPYVFIEVIRILAEADFDFMTIEKVKVEK